MNLLVSRPTYFIYFNDISNNLEIKKKLLPIIMNKKEEIMNNNTYINSDFKTSYITKFSNLNENYNNFLKEKYIINTIKNELKNMIYENKQLNFNIKDCFIGNMWFNIYNINEFKELEAHNFDITINNNNIYYPTFNFIYILNDDTLIEENINNKNNIIFKYSTNSHNLMPFSKRNKGHINSKFIKKVKEGTLFIFLSNIKYGTQKVKSNNRVTICGNIYCSY